MEIIIMSLKCRVFIAIKETPNSLTIEAYQIDGSPIKFDLTLSLFHNDHYTKWYNTGTDKTESELICTNGCKMLLLKR